MMNRDVEKMYRDQMALRVDDQVNIESRSMYFNVEEYIITDYITYPATSSMEETTMIRKTQFFIKNDKFLKKNVLIDINSEDYREGNIIEGESIIDIVNAKPTFEEEK
jgi:hypothetical protein